MLKHAMDFREVEKKITDKLGKVDNKLYHLVNRASMFMLTFPKCKSRNHDYQIKNK